MPHEPQHARSNGVGRASERHHDTRHAIAHTTTGGTLTSADKSILTPFRINNPGSHRRAPSPGGQVSEMVGQTDLARPTRMERIRAISSTSRRAIAPRPTGKLCQVDEMALRPGRMVGANLERTAWQPPAQPGTCPFTGGPWCHVVAGVGSQGLPVRALWMASMARMLWPRVLTR